MSWEAGSASFVIPGLLKESPPVLVIYNRRCAFEEVPYYGYEQI